MPESRTDPNQITKTWLKKHNFEPDFYGSPPQLCVPRQPVMFLEGYVHVPELDGTQAGGTRVPLGHGKVWALCTPFSANKATSGLTDISFMCPCWFMVHYIPCCKGTFLFPKCRDTGTLPKAQAMPTAPHSTLSPKTAPGQGTGPISECWIAGAWLGGHGLGSFLILRIRHCPPKPLNRAFIYIFFFQSPFNILNSNFFFLQQKLK